MAELQSPVKQGRAKNDIGEAIATTYPESGGKVLFSLQWNSARVEWGVRLRAASKKEIYSFIENWLPQCPHPDLMAAAIEELNKDFPGLLPN